MKVSKTGIVHKRVQFVWTSRLAHGGSPELSNEEVLRLRDQMERKLSPELLVPFCAESTSPNQCLDSSA